MPPDVIDEIVAAAKYVCEGCEHGSDFGCGDDCKLLDLMQRLGIWE